MRGTLVLDSAGLSGYIEGSRKVMLLIDAAHEEDRGLLKAPPPEGGGFQPSWPTWGSMAQAARSGSA
ncbi:hypothetical protein GCM10009800_18940 [Nocardiopsis rhodophaea]